MDYYLHLLLLFTDIIILMFNDQDDCEIRLVKWLYINAIYLAVFIHLKKLDKNNRTVHVLSDMLNFLGVCIGLVLVDDYFVDKYERCDHSINYIVWLVIIHLGVQIIGVFKTGINELKFQNGD